MDFLCACELTPTFSAMGWIKHSVFRTAVNSYCTDCNNLLFLTLSGPQSCAWLCNVVSSLYAYDPLGLHGCMTACQQQMLWPLGDEQAIVSVRGRRTLATSKPLRWWHYYYSVGAMTKERKLLRHHLWHNDTDDSKKNAQFVLVFIVVCCCVQSRFIRSNALHTDSRLGPRLKNAY